MFGSLSCFSARYELPFVPGPVFACGFTSPKGSAVYTIAFIGKLQFWIQHFAFL